MYFFRPLMDLVRSLLGSRACTYFKPSQQREAFLGFDQGWAVTAPIKRDEFHKRLQAAIASGSSSVGGFYLGFFLQFKIVIAMKRKSTYAPNTFVAPYFRSELDLEPNDQTQLSQHETLVRLQSIAGSKVSYACAMLFDESEVIETADLAKLRIVPISTAPTGWKPDQRHFIAFQTMLAVPQWCSQAVPGDSLTPEQWARQIVQRRLSGHQMMRFLEQTEATLREENQAVAFAYPPSLTVVEVP
jgi:hypothetical protein